MKPLDFTADNLEANRRGEMTERQRFFLRESRKAPIFDMILSVACAIALVCYALSKSDDMTLLWPTCLCGVPVCGALLLRAANEHDDVLRDLSARVLSIEGRAECSSHLTNALLNSNFRRLY